MRKSLLFCKVNCCSVEVLHCFIIMDVKGAGLQCSSLVDSQYFSILLCLF